MGLGSPQVRAESPVVDVTQYKDGLIVLQVAPERYLVTSLDQMRNRTFWSTEQGLNQLRPITGDSEGEPPDYTQVWARFADYTLGYGNAIRLEWNTGTWTLRCGDTEVPVQEVTGGLTEQIIEDSTFRKPAWDRVPIMLARDEYGTYYYVDQDRWDRSYENLHVYSGWMGKMSRTKLVLVAEDSEGSIFATRSGDRRLIMDKDMYRWVEDDVSHVLRKVPIDANWSFIFTTLGVYEGQDYGTPCDLL